MIAGLTGDEYSAKYYSDNAYFNYVEQGGPGVAPRIVHMSCDAEKMEASHSAASLGAMRKILKTNAGLVDSKMSRIYDILFDEMVMTPQAILGTYLVKVPGLPSGVAGTSTCNSFLMRQVILRIFDWLNGGRNGLDFVLTNDYYEFIWNVLKPLPLAVGVKDLSELKLKYNTF
jgi:hypothetical protein